MYNPASTTPGQPSRVALLPEWPLVISQVASSCGHRDDARGPLLSIRGGQLGFSGQKQPLCPGLGQPLNLEMFYDKVCRSLKGFAVVVTLEFGSRRCHVMNQKLHRDESSQQPTILCGPREAAPQPSCSFQNIHMGTPAEVTAQAAQNGISASHPPNSAPSQAYACAIVRTPASRPDQAGPRCPKFMVRERGLCMVPKLGQNPSRS